MQTETKREREIERDRERETDRGRVEETEAQTSPKAYKHQVLLGSSVRVQSTQIWSIYGFLGIVIIVRGICFILVLGPLGLFRTWCSKAVWLCG